LLERAIRSPNCRGNTQHSQKQSNDTFFRKEKKKSRKSTKKTKENKQTKKKKKKNKTAPKTQRTAGSMSEEGAPKEKKKLLPAEEEQ